MPRKKKKIFSTAGIIVLVNVIALFFLLIGFGREYINNLQVDREIQALEQQYEELEQERLDTLELIDRLSSSYYLEKQARTKHGLAKPGETLVVVEDDDLREDANVDEQSGSNSVINPLRWYYYFFDKDVYRQLTAL